MLYLTPTPEGKWLLIVYSRYLTIYQSNSLYGTIDCYYRLCNTHLQMAGFPAAKRERRHHKKERSHISISSPPDSSKVQSVEPTSSSMEMSDGDPYAFSDDGDHNQALEAHYENDKKSPNIGSPPQSSPMAVEPLTPSSMSSSSIETEINVCKKKSTGGNPTVQNVSKIKLMKFDLKPSKKRKLAGFKSSGKIENCRLPAVLQQLDDSMHLSKSPKYLLPDKIQDCEDESDAVSYCPLPRFMTAYLAAENTRRHFQLKEKSNEMRRQYLQLTSMMEAEQKYFGRHQSILTEKLLQAARYCPEETALLLQGRKQACGSSLTNASSNRHIFTKHKCSFVAKHKEKSGASCPEFALPCSTLCSRHILYSVDQQLFEFCSARVPSGNSLLLFSKINFYFTSSIPTLYSPLAKLRLSMSIHENSVFDASTVREIPQNTWKQNYRCNRTRNISQLK